MVWCNTNALADMSAYRCVGWAENGNGVRRVEKWKKKNRRTPPRQIPLENTAKTKLFGSTSAYITLNCVMGSLRLILMAKNYIVKVTLLQTCMVSRVKPITRYSPPKVKKSTHKLDHTYTHNRNEYLVHAAVSIALLTRNSRFSSPANLFKIANLFK